MFYRNIKDYTWLEEDRCDNAVGIYLLVMAVITAVLINIGLFASS